MSRTPLVLALLLLPSGVRAQEAARARPLGVERAEVATLVDTVARVLVSDYVFVETGERAARQLRENRDAGRYDDVADPVTLADRLTADLFSVAHDLHLRVMARRPPPPGATPAPRRSFEDRWREQNWGMEETRILPGNVGYVRMTVFPALALSAGAIAAAMDSVAGTSALILDVRDHVGGEPETVAQVVSYLLGPDRTLINTVEWRAEGVEELWSTGDLPGPRYGPDRPVFVVVGPRTFSAGEELAYDLQALGRATLVGDTTKGGANPAPMMPLFGVYSMQVPTGAAVNPITGGNWEGSGVAPDVLAPETDALNVAERLALRAIVAGAASAEVRAAARAALDSLEKGSSR